ncbi:MAG: right-handed parallel beta-helix repeat-containing protein, partial [Myxococcota bacterium]
MGRIVSLLGCLALGLLWAPSATAQTTIAGGNIINQTWTAAGSPYRVNGDITVPAGAFLRIEAGTVVNVATSDGLGSGLNTSEVEITVAGSLQINGTAAEPVTVQGLGSGTNAWYGIVVNAGATEALMNHATIREATYGTRSSAAGTALVMNDVTISGCTNGILLEAGAPLLQRLVVENGSTGIRANAGASVTVRDSILRSNSSRGLYVIHNSSTTGDSALDGSTVYGNGTGVYLSTSGSSRRLTVTDSIVSNNSTGVSKVGSSSSSTLEVSTSNVWGNSTNFTGSITGTNRISANPLYVSAPSNLRITENSPCRLSASGGG